MAAKITQTKTAGLILLLLVISFSTYSQTTDTTWRSGGKAALTFTQVAFTNWAAGGENSLGGNGFLDLFANYAKDKHIWDNNLSLAYGMLKLEGQNTRKSQDKIDLNSKYGYNIATHLFLSTNFNFSTQFSDGYNYPNDSVLVSTFMAPAYAQLGFGLDYKPTDYFSLSFLPLTARLTFVTNQPLANLGAYGVEPAVYDTNGVLLEEGENLRTEFGGALMALFEKELVKNISFKSKLQLFSNYLDNPQNIDLNWDSMISLTVNKYISTFVGIHVIYDDDIIIVEKDGTSGPRTQFKQSFGIGLAYDF